jgi:hypothetical protein
MLRTQIYNEIIAYIVPARFVCAEERVANVLPNLGLRTCIVEQAVLDRHKKVLTELAEQVEIGVGPNKDSLLRNSRSVAFTGTESATLSFKPAARRYMGSGNIEFGGRRNEGVHKKSAVMLLPRVTCSGPQKFMRVGYRCFNLAHGDVGQKNRVSYFF